MILFFQEKSLNTLYISYAELELVSIPCLVIVVGPEEDGYEGEPDDAGGVHREPDVLGLVEVLWIDG